jgi:hypothetical protein
MPFCSGYVLLDSGNLLIAGGPLWQVYTDSANEDGVPTTRGPVSLYVPSEPLTYEDGGWAVTDSLPDASGATIPTACADNPLNRNRYYPTLTTMPDGRVLVSAGDFWNDCNGDSIMTNTVQLGIEFGQNPKWLLYDDTQAAGSKWEVQSPFQSGGFTNPWSPSGVTPMASYPQE